MPVMSEARVGEHSGVAWKFVNRIPLSAMASRFGVGISPPKQPMSEYPRSSASITMMLGLSGRAEANLAQAAAALGNSQ